MTIIPPRPPRRIVFANTQPKCRHQNGWFKSVTFKWWIFDLRRSFFLCTDCEDLIPREEFEEVWKHLKEQKKNDQTT